MEETKMPRPLRLRRGSTPSNRVGSDLYLDLGSLLPGVRWLIYSLTQKLGNHQLKCSAGYDGDNGHHQLQRVL